MADIKGKFPNGLDAAMKRMSMGPTALADLIGDRKQNIVRWADQSRKLPAPIAQKMAPHLKCTAADLLLVDGAAGKPMGEASRPPAPKFIKSRKRFFVKDWREYMGVSVAVAARTVGLDEDEYEAHEFYPVNFSVGQIMALADEFGVRGDQFWFPPPAKSPATAERITKSGARSITITKRR